MRLKHSKEIIIKERLNRNFGYFYTVKRILYSAKTKYQHMRFLDTEEFGRVLVLDGIFQVSEKKDYQYHEPMVHPAMSVHPNPRQILVVGGGDGGILREVLKYECVENVDLAEIDEEVIRFSRKYLSSMMNNALDDPRVKIHISDGRKWVEQNPRQYDVIIMDITDPFGPSKMLYTAEFYGLVKRALRNRRGIFVMQSESPITRPDAFASICKTLRISFRHVCPLFVYIQMYATLWSICLCSEATDLSAVSPRRIDMRMQKYGIRDLKMYNGAVKRAWHTMLPFVESIMKTRGRVITDKEPDFPDDFLKEK